jgi:hypothetical protein
MFRHKKCSQVVSVDLSKSIALLSPINFDRDGIKIVAINFVKTNSKPVYFCSACSCNIENTELYGYCMECGKFFDLKVLFRLSKSGGMYCASCIDGNFKGESRKNLLEISSNIEI